MYLDEWQAGKIVPLVFAEKNRLASAKLLQSDIYEAKIENCLLWMR